MCGVCVPSHCNAIAQTLKIYVNIFFCSGFVSSVIIFIINVFLLQFTFLLIFYFILCEKSANTWFFVFHVINIDCYWILFQFAGFPLLLRHCGWAEWGDCVNMSSPVNSIQFLFFSDLQRNMCSNEAPPIRAINI